MAGSAGALSRAVARMIAPRTTIVATETPADGFVAITLEAPGFRSVTWTPGCKVQVAMGSVFETRTYTPVEWDPARGRTRIVGFLHGAGPGSAWLREATVGDTCDVLGPRHSLDLRKAAALVALFGDETSLGLARALSSMGVAASCRFEARDPASMRRTAGAWHLRDVEVVARTAGDGHLDMLVAPLPALAVAGTTFVLTGRAQAIQRLRAELRNLGVPPGRIMAKAYWAPGKVGLD